MFVVNVIMDKVLVILGHSYVIIDNVFSCLLLGLQAFITHNAVECCTTRTVFHCWTAPSAQRLAGYPADGSGDVSS